MARRSAAVWDVGLMEADRLRHGWNYSDLAKRAETTASSVTRFMEGKVQTPGMAKKIAEALGFTTDRYLRVPETDVSHPGQLSLSLADSVGGQ